MRRWILFTALALVVACERRQEATETQGVSSAPRSNALVPLKSQELAPPFYSPPVSGKAPTATEVMESRRFVDVAGAVLADVPEAFAQQGRGIADWCGKICKFADMGLTGHHGIAVADVDGDGREDVFVCDGGSLPNRLYRQRDDGSVEDFSKEAGLAWLEDSRSALLIDLDNDGDQDLVVATIAMIAFAENDGAGRFTLRGGFPGAQYPFSMAAADYDLDGDLDIYACLYGEGDSAIASGGRGFASHTPVPFEDASNGGRNVLLANEGGFAFADVTEEVGLDEENSRWSFAAAWEDYDRDGDADLYVANDFGRNVLYRNDGGHFSEVALGQRVGDIGAGMSVSWGDANGDSWPDLYVGNMYSKAGLQLMKEPVFVETRGAETIAALKRMALGNSLYLGGPAGFSETNAAAGAAMGKWAWSSGFADLNGDGRQDLLVANGYVSGWAVEDDW